MNYAPVLLLLVILAILPSMIAQEKGRSMGRWYIYSYLLFPIALIHAFFLKEREETEKCPRCKKEISVLALECKHCAYKLAGEFRV